MRLDIYLAGEGLAKSREYAKIIIKEGFVSVNGTAEKKPSRDISDSDAVIVTGGKPKYVSRGGYKLEKAAEVWMISLAGRTCLDIGASTGGFTDFMLKNGAARVYACDVGRGQLDASLREDKRVVNIEGINVKDIEKNLFDEEITFIAADLSFISLTYALPAIKKILPSEGLAVALIKPQFEVGKAYIGKNGIVKDPKAHNAAIEKIKTAAAENGLSVIDICLSPIKGGDGNIEFLAEIAVCDYQNKYICQKNK